MLFLRTGNELASTVLNLTINPLPSVIGRFRSLKYHTAIYWSKYLCLETFNFFISKLSLCFHQYSGWSFGM